MNIQKLYHVLVVGGAMMSLNSMAHQNTLPILPLASEEPIEEPEKAPCLCNTEECCKENACGNLEVKKGFYCCWGTECE